MKYIKHKNQNNDENYFISTTDLFIGVIFVFLIIIMSMMVKTMYLDRQNISSDERIVKLNQEIDKLNQLIADMQNNLSISESENARLKNSLARNQATEEEIDRLNRLVADMQNNLTISERENAQLKNSLTENQVTKEQIDRLNRIIADIRNSLTTSEEENSRLKNLLSASQTSERDLYTENAELKKSLEDTNRLLSQLQGKLKTSNDEKEELRGALIDLFAQTTKIRGDMLKKLSIALKKKGYDTIVDEENGILRIPERMLFARGEFKLTKSTEAALNDLAQVLEQILPEYVWQLNTDNTPFCAKISCLEAIYIEGHADKMRVKDKIGIEIMDNLALSAARANTTFRQLTSHSKINNMHNEHGEKLLGVSGYGEFRPIDEHNYDKNRRIDLRFLMSAPKIGELKFKNE